MNKQKLMYEAPTAQTFVVRFEGMICTSPGIGANGLQGGNVIDGNDVGFDGWDD